MTEEQLNQFIKELKIARDHILREEAEMDILQELSRDKLSLKLVFYGGTAMRLAYNSPRFFEDLDFLAMGKIKFDNFKIFVQNLISQKDNWKLADIKDKRQTIFALINIKDSKLKHPFSIKIEIHKPARKPNFKPELLLIQSPVSVFKPLFLVPSLKDLKELKLEAIKNRKKSRDIFDLWFIDSALRQQFEIPIETPDYPRRLFVNDMQKFLPKNHWKIIEQLYEKINKKNRKN